MVDAHERAVRRDRHDVHLVGLGELRRLGVGGAGHAGDLLVEAEVVLEGDRRERLVLLGDAHRQVEDPVLARLDHLVQPLAPAPARHQPAGELVDDDDLVVVDDVVDVALVELLGAQRLQRDVALLHLVEVVQALDAPGAAGPGLALLGERDGLVLLVGDVVDALLERGAVELRPDLVLVGDPPPDERLGQLDRAVVDVGRLLDRPADDQRRARLVDEDRVDLVDDREVQLALDVLGERELHVVAQVVEAVLVVRPEGHVAAVGGLALRSCRSCWMRPTVRPRKR